MIRMNTRLALICLTTTGTCVAATPRRADAFDSAGAEFGTVTHNVPQGSVTFPLGWHFGVKNPLSRGTEDPLSLQSLDPSKPHYVAAFVHYTFGGMSAGGPDDRAVSNLLLCTRVPGARSFDGCEPAVSFPEKVINNLGWVKTRRAWNVTPTAEELGDGHGAEHLAGVLLAAKLAGFDTTSIFKTPMFIRYPAANRMIASPVSPTNKGTGEVDSNVVAGPSFVPVTFDKAASHVVRAISLAELVQLPDESYSISDWANGNEVCPLKGVTSSSGASIFGENHDADVNACHEYERALGVLNISHFMPAAESFFRYYHRLAVERMAVCRTLAETVIKHYQDNDSWYEYGTLLGRAGMATNTEAHECEREALVFEMVAQHYLQDAWATGHMWSRWGHPEFSKYPASLGIGGIKFKGPDGFPTGLYKSDRQEWAPEGAGGIPEVNLAPRRAAIAAVVAGYAGAIHGAKAVTASLRRSGQSWLNAVWTTWGGARLPKIHADALDDPLSAPKFSDLLGGGKTKDVSWTDVSAPSTLYPGVGDMFAARYGITEPVEVPEYAVQRKRMLGCSAASLREVYTAGPELHGKLGPADSSISDITSPTDDRCWKHWATNSSMLGSTGPFFLRRKWDTDKLDPMGAVFRAREGFLAHANAFVADSQASSYHFEDKKDEQFFLGVLADRIHEEHWKVMKAFVVNAKNYPNGNESAQLFVAPALGTPGPDTITFFGVQPNVSYGAGEAPATSTIDLPPSENLAVRRMFWRSHLVESCQNAAQRDPISGKLLIQALRDRCVSRAAEGGDPESCTACVELAEPHIVRDGIDTVSTDPRSRCARAGVTADLSSLPPKFFSVTGSVTPEVFDEAAENRYLVDRPAFWAAFSYCTDTQRPLSGLQHGDGEHLLSVYAIKDSACTNDDGTPRRYTERYRSRVGFVRTEYPFAKTVDAPAQVPGPIVNAIEIDYKFVEVAFPGPTGGNTCFGYTRSMNLGLDPTIAEAPYGGIDEEHSPSNDFPTDWRRAAMNDDALAFRSCGQAQRVFWWDRSCADVQSLAVETGDPGGFIKGIKFDPHPWEPATSKSGFWIDGYDFTSGYKSGFKKGTRCEIRERRRYFPYCGTGTVCGAGGTCVAQASVGAPETRFLDVTPYESPVGTCPIGSPNGGAYKSLCVRKTEEERHHFPCEYALSVIPLSADEAPAIVMTVADHLQTLTHGSRSGSAPVRAGQRERLLAGRFWEVFDEEAAWLETQFGGRYVDAVRKARAYANTIDPKKLGIKP